MKILVDSELLGDCGLLLGRDGFSWTTINLGRHYGTDHDHDDAPKDDVPAVSSRLDMEPLQGVDNRDGSNDEHDYSDESE